MFWRRQRDFISLSAFGCKDHAYQALPCTVFSAMFDVSPCFVMQVHSVVSNQNKTSLSTATHDRSIFLGHSTLDLWISWGSCFTFIFDFISGIIISFLRIAFFPLLNYPVLLLREFRSVYCISTRICPLGCIDV